MDLQKILDQTISLVKEVGKYIYKEGQDFDRSKIEMKGFNDLVSYVDKEAEKKLVKGLGEILPGSGFIAEEGTAKEGEEEYKWIIDPIDGTTNFLHSLPMYAVSVALMYKDKLVLGVVYEIVGDECFYALDGGKAYCNGKEIKVSSVKKIGNSLLATGFPYYDFDMMQIYLGILDHFMKNTHGLRRMGSAAIDLVYVACGRFEGFYEYNLSPWDVAAGVLIVKQAGGKVTDFKGGDDYVFGRELIATNESIHNEMLQVIKERWFQEQENKG